MPLSEFSAGVWLIDFEFHPRNGVEGNPPDPVCLVAREFTSGRTLKVWRDDLRSMKSPPFPVDERALVVAYFSSAEIRCFDALGWETPQNVLDLFAEFRVETNGLPVPCGNGLLGALVHHGIFRSGASENKEEMRRLILSGGPWSPQECADILTYCETDVTALADLLRVMLPDIDLPRALLRGEYMCAVARMETNGIPVDTAAFKKLKDGWDGIKTRLISQVDRQFNVYSGTTFKLDKFEDLLAREQIAWPRLPSGQPDLSAETFKFMAQVHPQLTSLRELRDALSKMRLSGLSVGEDGRNRCLISPFQSSTGRNQPSTSKFIFGSAAWLRGLIKPAEGCGVAYIDWSQQEFGIAAALSCDENMMKAYVSGDPYLTFAKQAGAVPEEATRYTHAQEREQFKACVLAVQYGMGAESLALRIRQPVERARQLLSLHHRTYQTFWSWSDKTLDEALLCGKLRTNFGWQILVKSNANPRSLRNFPMQAHGAEMLRIACVLLMREGIRVCAPVHDAVLVEAPLDCLDSIVAKAQALMQEASQIVLGGFALGSDAKITGYPDRYRDERGVPFWEAVMELLEQPDPEEV